MENQALAIAKVSAAVAYDIADFLVKRGFDPKELYKKAGIGIYEPFNPNHIINLHSYTYLLHLAAETSAYPALGLTLGANQDPSKWGAFGYVALYSPSILAAFENVVKFMRLYQTGTHVELVKSNQCIGLSYSIIDPRVIHKRQDAEFAIAYFNNIVDRLCGRSVIPENVYFEHSPLSPQRMYKKMFGIAPEFDQSTNLISYRKALIEKPIPSTDPRLYALICDYLRDLCQTTPVNTNLIDTLKYYILQLLPLQKCSLRRLAQMLDTDPRTLQRRLAAKGTSYGLILKDIRLEEAVRSLITSSAEIKEISFSLGYSETSIFTRAFKKWTGLTPSQYRADNASLN